MSHKFGDICTCSVARKLVLGTFHYPYNVDWMTIIVKLLFQLSMLTSWEQWVIQYVYVGNVI